MICPNCVTKLKPDKKKLGKRNNWMVCPNCGFRTKPNEDIESPNIIRGVKPNKRILEDEQNNYYNNL